MTAEHRAPQDEVVSVSVQQSHSTSQRVVPIRQRFKLLSGNRPRPKLHINRERLTRPTIPDAAAQTTTTAATTTRRSIISRSRFRQVQVLEKRSTQFGGGGQIFPRVW